MKKIILGFILLPSLFVVSCATVTGPTTQSIAIESNVKGADVKIDGISYGQTPTVIQLKGKSSYLLTVEKKCYMPKNQMISGDPRILAGVVGNIFNLTGLIGMAIDYFDGAFFKMPTNQSVMLEQSEDVKCGK